MTAHLRKIVCTSAEAGAAGGSPNSISATLMRLNEARESLFMFALTEEESILSS